MSFKNLSFEVIDKCLDDFNHYDVQNKLRNYVLDPAIDHIITRIQPYILGASLFFTILVLLIITILILIIKRE